MINDIRDAAIIQKKKIVDNHASNSIKSNFFNRSVSSDFKKRLEKSVLRKIDSNMIVVSGLHQIGKTTAILNMFLSTNTTFAYFDFEGLNYPSDSRNISDLHIALNNTYGSRWSTILLENVEGLTSIKSLLEYFKSLKILVILTSSVHPLAWMPRNGFQSDSWINNNSFIELVPLNYISWANQNSDILDKMGEDVFYRYGSLPIAIRNYYDYESEEDALKYNAKLFDDIIASYVLKLDQTFQPSSVVTIANMLLNHCGQKVDLRQISDFSKVSFSKTFAIVLALQNTYLFKTDIFNDANVLPTFSVRSDYTGQDSGDLAQGYDSCKVILNIDVYNIGFLFAKNANLESHQRLQNQWKEANKKLI